MDDDGQSAHGRRLVLLCAKGSGAVTRLDAEAGVASAAAGRYVRLRPQTDGKQACPSASS
jgi:hypothetical protein